MNNSKTIAIIMARGGSKGLPKKNVRSLNGKPLIAYSIEDAINSGVCDTVLVTSEDDEINKIAKEYGATVSLKGVPKEASIKRSDALLFSESNSCFVASFLLSHLALH